MKLNSYPQTRPPFEKMIANFSDISNPLNKTYNVYEYQVRRKYK